MKTQMMLAAALLLVCTTSSAIDQKYREKLERSGCTQVTEMQGCDINKTKAQNAQAGFGDSAPPVAASTYAGTWTATNAETHQTVATIRIDNNNRVTVNGKSVAARPSDGALVFKDGFVTYTIQGDPRIQNESSWFNSDVKNSGPIRRQ